MVVTTTGMATEVGQISGMLSDVQQEKTPLTRQLDQLTVLLTIMAGAALALVVVLGLIHGDDFDELFLIGISLAVAAIPTGLPAVVTTVLSLGTQALAAKGAIVKRLRSVETLGSTSAICSDKTGTLTLNQMTARQLVVAGRRYSIEGEGYSTNGKILHVAGETGYARSSRSCCRWRSRTTPRFARARSSATRRRRRSSCWRRRAGSTSTRRGASTRASVRCRSTPTTSSWRPSTRWRTRAGRSCAASSRARPTSCSRARRRSGTWTARPFPPRPAAIASWPRTTDSPAKACACWPWPLATSTRARSTPARSLLDEVEGLTLLALVAIVDPPRKEAKDAIARCKEAGIRARMITGDHATTAAAIAAQLGIEGRALTGTEFAALSDAELDEQVDDIGVVARVAPEDKVRLVDVLKRKGNVVSMTGDGVNDAPALKRSDIGVAMGITGTEVTKEAADMILTDDNFATIVAAVEGGRGIYDNLMKYVRVQLVMLGGFILTFVGAGIFDIADGAPLTPLQILWINFAVDVLLAIGLGFDAAVPGLMRRAPRDASAPIVDRALGVRLAIAGLIMAALALARGRLGRGALRPRRRHDDGTDDALADARRRSARGSRADGNDLQSLHAREPPVRAADRRWRSCSRSSSPSSSPCSGSSTRSR